MVLAEKPCALLQSRTCCLEPPKLSELAQPVAKRQKAVLLSAIQSVASEAKVDIRHQTVVLGMGTTSFQNISNTAGNLVGHVEEV